MGHLRRLANQRMWDSPTLETATFQLQSLNPNDVVSDMPTPTGP